MRVVGNALVGLGGLHMGRHLEQQRAQVRHEIHRHHPRQHQRNHRHGKNREGVFTRHRLGNANRQKASRRDQGARQHGHGRQLIGKGGGAHLVVALFQLQHHHFDGDDGVVHQQAQRDDERAQRNLVQANAPVPHGQKGHGQHHGNGDAHHQAGPGVDVPALPQRVVARALVQAQADEAHGQHDDHGFDQHLHKFVDRRGHGLGLVLHIDQLDARWQRVADALRGLFQRLAQGNDVAALGHRDTQRNHLTPLVAHLHGGRVYVATLDLCNIAQAELRTRRAANRHGPQVFNGVELAAHTHLHLVQRGLHCPGRFHGVLLAQLRQHLVEIQPQLRQALLRDFDKQLFVLHAELLYLGHIAHAQQLLAHIVGKGLQLCVAEAFGLQRVDHAIHIAELIVEERPLHAGGQRVAHVAHLLAHRVPDVGHLVRAR